ncbi:MAG: PQQ-binding-like beta-propeller repeat protein [Planctomycetota bacterium]
MIVDWLRAPSVLAMLLVASSALGDWPAFLGGSSRAASDAARPPIKWTADQNVAWQAELPGHGQSSPVVVGDIVYVTAIEGPMKETNLVIAFDLKTGNRLWQQEFSSSLPVENNVYTCRAAPTPVADADGVVAFFESGNVVALASDGEVRWQRDLLAEYGTYEGRFGVGGSMAQTDEHAIVLADNEGPAYIMALDKSTGETVWKTERESRTAWSSPMVMPIGDRQQVIVSAAGTIDGYDASTGELLWSFDKVGGNTVASPTPAGENQFLIGASPGRNGENAAGAKESNLLMRINVTDGEFVPEVVWKNSQATSSFGSPIAYQGHAYFTNRAGVLFCIDMATGDLAYTSRIGTSNWATPVGIDSKVYVFGKDGKTVVLAAGSEENILSENELWTGGGGGGGGGGRGNFGGEIQYGFAVMPKGFVVRTGSRLVGVGEF